ncbi:MAG: hypothetical protein ACRC42_00785 [Mycoplasma sp.]
MKKYTIEINKKSHDFHAIENMRGKYVFIYLNGINGQVDTIEYFKFDLIKKNTIVTFDAIAHGNNPLPHTKNLKKHIKYTVNMIDAIKKHPRYAKKTFVILGESFGAGLTIALSQQHNKLAHLFFCWNAPTIIDPETKITFLDGLKLFATICLNIETYSKNRFSTRYTSNREIIFAQRQKGYTKTSNKVILAALATIKNNVKTLKSDDLPGNLHYVQSFEDIMFDKTINLQDKNNIYTFEEGKHLLSFEPQAIEMFEILKNKL